MKMLDEVRAALREISTQRKKAVIELAKQRSKACCLEDYRFYLEHGIYDRPPWPRFESLESGSEILIVNGRPVVAEVPAIYMAAIKAIWEGDREWNSEKYPDIADFLESVIRSMAANAYRKLVRIKKRYAKNDLLQEIMQSDLSGTAEPDPLAVIETAEVLKLLRQRLSDSHRRALDVLIENDFETQTEFAEFIGWSKSSVSKYLNQVRNILEELLYK